MIIGILKEPKDPRVALIPDTVANLIKAEHEVLVEHDAGQGAHHSDEAYQEAGAGLATRQEVLQKSQLLVCLNPPKPEELSSLPKGTAVIALFNPLVETELADLIRGLDILAFSMDRIPRISIAQSMDVLSSMASMAGYKAVLVAANYLQEYFPMLMTAAGTVPPAKMLILGAGVAGLQAIATGKRLGATIEVFDVRAAVKEEVLSLGGKFIEVEGAAEDKDAGGYAIEQGEEYQRKQKELIHTHAAKSNVIITTASIPGKKAPLLIEERTVKAMKAGSVIVDLAAGSGGNCAVTKNDEVIVYDGVTVIGNSNLPAEMAVDASRLYSNNIFNFIKYVFPNGTTEVDRENEVVKGSLIQ